MRRGEPCCDNGLLEQQGPHGAEQPPPSAGGTVTGQTTSAVSGAAVGGIAVRINGAGVATSDANGNFQVTQSSSGRQGVALTGPDMLERRTSLTFPGPHAALGLIPRSFDLAAFDQMFRKSGQLTRWTTAPQLVVETRVLVFSTLEANDFATTEETLSSAEVQTLTADLTAGLAALTGGRFTSFSSPRVDASAFGSRVNLERTGQIVVARFKGLTSRTGYAGFGKWATQADGRVVGGVAYLDRDFDKSSSAFRRAIRMHELGHTLGYNHVTARPSLMNPSPRTEVTAFDRLATSIAFQRPVGSRTPDIDPDGFSSNAAGMSIGGIAVWGPAIH